LLILSTVAIAQSTSGQWGPLLSFPYEVTHAQLLPDGRVLMWPPYANGDNPQIWDPVSGSMTSASKAGYNLFCAGHSHLAGGRIFVAGGQAGTIHYGVANASIYDSSTNTWLPTPPMYTARWYPTSTTLANGDVLVTGGAIDPAVGNTGLAEIWQHATNTWQDLTSAQLITPLYPRMFLAPNGRVFYAGDLPTTRYLDTSGTGKWTTVAVTQFRKSRDYGSAVQYGDGKIVIIGGSSPPTASTEVIDLTVASPAWRAVASMSSPRREINATLLADGEVFVNGGTSGTANDGSHAVLPTEIWNPKTESWTTTASEN
jgi:hypothetical protein